jgi:hypothetical protein
MADEATVYSSLQINKGNLQYRSAISAFRVTVTGTFGPVVGAITATTNGVDVTLSGITVPGLCEVTNLDTVNSVILGRWDPSNSRFYPLLEVGPGESYVIKLARHVTDEYEGTGTGTAATATTLRVKAENAPCSVVFRIFER